MGKTTDAHMKGRNGVKYNQYVNRIFSCLGCGALGCFGLFALCELLVVRQDATGWIALSYIALACFWLVLSLYAYPKVSMDQQSVCVKWWFRTHFYSWGDICQVGISCFMQRNFGYTNRLVLVPSGCSKRGYRDYLFHLRNFGKLIYIPVKPGIVDFVCSYCGPLDFDRTDGRAEESVEVEMPLDTGSDW
jgi:hypothetical protein